MAAPKGSKHALGNKGGHGAKVLCSIEVVATARDYIENFKEEKYGDLIPSVVGLAKVLKVRRETLYLWAKYEGDKVDGRSEFKDIMAAINEAQEHTLLNNGLSGVFVPVITKLVLAKHGYHDKQDTSIAAPDGGPVKAQFNFIPVGPGNETD